MSEEEEIIELDWKDTHGVIEDFDIVDQEDDHPLLVALVNRKGYKVLAIHRLRHEDGMLKVGKGMHIKMSRARRVLTICNRLVKKENHA